MNTVNTADFIRIKNDDFEEATHWVSMDKDKTQYSHTTLGKVYKLFYNATEDEEYMIDDDGNYSLAFLCFDGYLIKMLNNDDKKCCLDLLVNMSLDTGDRDLFMKLTDEYNKMYRE